jgi:hypothetical protein
MSSAVFEAVDSDPSPISAVVGSERPAVTRQKGPIMPTKALRERLSKLLEDPACGDGPLRELCEEVLSEHEKLSRRMDRIGHISDAYQAQLREAKNELEATKAKLEETLADLKSSYWHLEKIQEVLPVCMECGAVRSGRSAWEPVLEYLKKNDLVLSHGYCPDCLPIVERRWHAELGDNGRKE